MGGYEYCSDHLMLGLRHAGSWRQSELDVTSMVQSTLTEAHNGKCLLVDMGAFHLVEFAKTLCMPLLGSAVHGGVHVLQVVPQTLSMRMLLFPVLDNTFKVGCTDTPLA